jgi:hypothetical protein
MSRLAPPIGAGGARTIRRIRKVRLHDFNQDADLSNCDGPQGMSAHAGIPTVRALSGDRRVPGRASTAGADQRQHARFWAFFEPESGFERRRGFTRPFTTFFGRGAYYSYGASRQGPPMGGVARHATLFLACANGRLGRWR